jgi:glycosyltransferase involved in cell wall biosynthesis
MNDVNCVVLPSYREGMPRSLLEAGAMGLPSVTTDVPGCRNIIQDNVNGFICEARNSKSLELAMLRMLNTRNEDIMRMGKTARKIVENSFDEKIVVDAYSDALSFFADN